MVTTTRSLVLRVCQFRHDRASLDSFVIVLQIKAKVKFY